MNLKDFILAVPYDNSNIPDACTAKMSVISGCP